MSKKRHSPHLLTIKYLRGELNETEANEFYQLLQTNPTIVEMVKSNLLCDLWLTRLFLPEESTEPTEQTIIGEQPDLHKQPELYNSPATSLFSNWDELVELQKKETPIRPPMEEEPPRPVMQRFLAFAKLCLGMDKEHRNESIAPVFTAICLLIAMVLCILFNYDLVRKDPDRQFYDEPITTIARVNEILDVVWEPGAPEYKRGQLVDESKFLLKSGMVLLEMNNGTTLVLEGPADLTVNSAMSAFCPLGKVSAHVPRKAISYSISTPQGNVVDRGTEFFLDISDENTEVNVITGQVDFCSRSKDILSLFAGKGLRVDLYNKMEKLSFTTMSRFMSIPLFQKKVREQADKIMAERLKKNEQIDFDPRLLVRLDFNTETIKSIHNMSRQSNALQPLYCRGRRTSGIEAETCSLMFRNSRDGVSLDLPGSFRSLTLEAVVRFEPLKDSTGVIFSSNDLFHKTGGILWQITKEGAVQLQIATNSDGGLKNYSTVPCLGVMQRGTWIRLKVVVDGKKKTIRHFVNGKEIAPDRSQGLMNNWRNPLPLVPGSCTIGNFIGKGGGNNNRSLKMAVSEFFMYQDAIYNIQ